MSGATPFLPAIAGNVQYEKGEVRSQSLGMKNVVDANTDCLEFNDQCSVCSLMTEWSSFLAQDRMYQGEYRSTMRSK
ncbi:hypothetical protein T190_24760 [Sinorhizobium meliloti CCBAU 01290]|nr:hypothetical protein T190_24760 [Sinorhizobium meliloti CCBAU 01290]